MILVFAVAIICVIADQVTKYLISSSYAVGEGTSIIDGVFRLTYIKNEGAAFGSLSDARWIFMTASTLLIIAIIGYAVWKRPKSKLLCVTLGLLAGGGIGNMIDRVALGYVVDFLDFCAFPDLWKWIFNFADVFVCVATGLLILYIIRYDDKAKPEVAEAAADDTPTEDVKGGDENNEAE